MRGSSSTRTVVVASLPAAETFTLYSPGGTRGPRPPPPNPPPPPPPPPPNCGAACGSAATGISPADACGGCPPPRPPPPPPPPRPPPPPTPPRPLPGPP